MSVENAVEHVWRALGGGPRPTRIVWSGPSGTLASPLPVDTLARACVAACALAAAGLRGVTTDPVRVDSGAVATAFVSERVLRRDGAGFAGFAPLSRFWPARDGWVRTHANYPHHRARLLDLLGFSPDPACGPRPEEVGAAIANWAAADLERVAAGAGALAFAVRTRAAWLAHPQGAAVAAGPPLRLDRVTDSPAAPAPDRPRVLDLTRVIAGPVGTRTLALLGADVLRVDSPRLPEIEAQHLDTGFGKRTTLLDLDSAADRRTFTGLLERADVVVTGYRPGALDRHGLSAPALLERYPSLVVAQLSAWGDTGPWADRRGFDSLVQAATGIALECADGTGAPGTLPAQALDHGTGYLLAAAVLRALSYRAAAGGGWVARLALAGTAHWLLDLPRPSTVEDASVVDPAAWSAEVDGLRYALPPVEVPGAPRTWAYPPHPWGSDAPRFAHTD